ncbi:Protein MAIN-LIKE 1 [Glycine soja]
MHIMVRTRGLGRALGRVLGRALGRDDHYDSDDVPQRRRPTAFARRQREAALIVEDDPVLTEDVHAHGEKAVVDAERFPGGPHDPSMLTDYGDRVAVIVWNGEERPELKLISHGRKVQKFGRPAPEIEGLVAATGLSPLITCLVDTGDRGLISAFVERWHKETSNFHLPVEELTITLDDVASLLHLPIIGAFYSFEPLHVDEAVLMLVELLEVSGEEARAKTTQCHRAYIHLSICEAGHWTIAARAYLLHLLGCTLFANKSATHVHVVFLDSGSYAWGVATLVHMYDHLNDACKSGDQQLADYITLLQCWIYEHFPSVPECLTDPDYDEISSRACRWIATKTSLKSLPASTYRKHLDGLMILDVCWMPYGEHHGVWDFDLISCFSSHLRWGPVVVKHRPERVVRQFGYVQTIPPQTTASMLSFEDIDDMWMHYSYYLVAEGRICVVPGQCASDYMEWFFMISHPFMTPAQPADPPRHPLGSQDDTYVEPHIPEVPVAPAAPPPAHAPSDVEQPRHAEACQAIAERLERLNLRIVTIGIEIHEVMKDYIRITRGVTPDDNVYVRSQQR